MVTTLHLETGSQVVSADGKQLGLVKEVTADRFRVERRLLPDFWLAMEYVDNAAGGIVQMILTKAGMGAAKVNPPQS
jgi:hypothetical protein